MRITLKIFGELYRYMPNRRDQAEISVTEGTTLQELLSSLQIPDYAVWLVTVNAARVGPEYLLKAADTVEIFAPVGGG